MIGSSLKHVFLGYHAWIIAYKDELLRRIGLAPSTKIPLLNGSLPCELREYVIFDGLMSDFRKKEAKSRMSLLMLQFISPTANVISRMTAVAARHAMMTASVGVSAGAVMTRMHAISARAADLDAMAASAISAKGIGARTRCASETETAGRAISRNALPVRWSRLTMNSNGLIVRRKAVSLPGTRLLASSPKATIRWLCAVTNMPCVRSGIYARRFRPNRARS